MFGWKWLRACLLCFVAVGCSQDPADTESADTSTADGTSDADTASTSDAESVSDAATPDTTSPDTNTAGECANSTLVSILRGKVVDEGGAPVETARPQACVIVESGELICLRPPETNADGAFLQSVPFEAQCMKQLAMRISHSETTHATTYCPSTLPTSGSVLAFAAPFVLFETQNPLSLPPLGDPAVARDVTFTGDLTASLTPDQLHFAFGAYEDLRAAPISLDSSGLCFLETARPMGGLWAFYPEVATTGGGPLLRFPNTQGYNPGAAVDLFVLGGLDCLLPSGEHIPEGAFHLYGQGHVSADGLQIESDVGLPCLTWFGYAPAP